MKINSHSIIRTMHKQLLIKKTTCFELAMEALQKLELNKDLNAVASVLKNEALNRAKILDKKGIDKNNDLYGIPYMVKDNYNVLNTYTTASSRILINYIPPFESTPTNLLKTKQTNLIGKSVLDELGMGGNGVYAATGVVHNPLDKNRITGGSSSGSAAVVAAGVVPFALGSDTGDSVRKPASYCGIVGFKPTYGLISRWGLIPYAPSLDTVGIMSHNVTDIAIVASNLIKYDPHDATSCKLLPHEDYDKALKPQLKSVKFCYIKAVQNQLPTWLKTSYADFFNKLRQAGATVETFDFDLNLLKALLPIYRVISYAEANSTHANLDGINFGMRATGKDYRKIMINSRSKYLDTEVQKRLILGSYCLNEENQNRLFLKAKKIRRLIKNKIKIMFDQYDVLILPSADSAAPLISDIKKKKLALPDNEVLQNGILTLANMGGIPSLTIPFVLNNEKLPLGININTDIFKDQLCLNVGLALEDLIGFKNLQPRSV